MSYGFAGSSGTTLVELRVHAVAWVASSRSRGASARLFCGRCASRRRTASSASASSCAARCATPLRPVWTPAPPSDSASTSSWVTALHDVRPGDEHVARPLDHDREVRDGRRVHRAAGARSEDHGDLRHDARRQDVAQEDLRVAAQRGDALLDPRTAGIVEADDRRADLHRQVHDLADLLGVRLRERAAEDREVLAEDEDQPPVDRAVAGDDAIAEDALPVEAELRGPVGDERVELDEGPGVEQEVEALARRQLARTHAGARPGPLPHPRETRLASARGARSAPRWSTRPTLLRG